MSFWSIFRPLFRAGAAGRSRDTSFARRKEYSFLSAWLPLLGRLGLPPSTFHDLLETGSLHPHFSYRHFTKPKRDGGKRRIDAPDTKLKHIQRTILKRYLANQPAHSSAVAYRTGRSTADHAWAHAGADIVITADVQDFFPSTRAWRIERWWMSQVEEDLARLLTLLTTWQGGLPQGAPSSPALSNIVNVEMDERLLRRTLETGGCYTRYCDDLAFSWRRDAKTGAPGKRPGRSEGRAPWGLPADFAAGVRSLLLEYGYELHPKKGWRVQYRADEPALVGVILTRRGRVRLPDDIRQKMRALARSNDPRDLQRLLGYQGYESMMSRRRTAGIPKRLPDRVHRTENVPDLPP
jgi:RNA-directed DNA polymerase